MIPVDQDSAAKRAALLGLKVAGASSWLAAYRVAIDETRDSGALLLPRAAIAFNLTWEAIYSAGGVYTWRKLTPEDKVQTLINISWLAADAAWVRAIRKAGGDHPSPRVLALALGYQLAFLASKPPGDAARVSALWQNLGFAAYCAAVPGRGAAGSTRPLYFTAFRLLGTAVPTFTSGALRGIRPRYLLPGLATMACDAVSLGRELSSKTE